MPCITQFSLSWMNAWWTDRMLARLCSRSFWSRPPQPEIWASLEACCLLHRCSCTVLRALRLGQSSLLPLSTLQLHSAACSPLGAIGQLVAHSASWLFQHCGCIVLRALRLGQSSNLFTRRPSDIVPRYSMQFGIEFCFTGGHRDPRHSLHLS